MASFSRASFWLYVLKDMKSGTFPFGHMYRHSYISRSTGDQCINIATSKYESWKEIGWFDSCLVYPITPSDSLPHSIQNSYFKILSGTSWKQYDSKVIDYCKNSPLYTLAIVILIVIIMIYLVYWCAYFNMSRKKC